MPLPDKPKNDIDKMVAAERDRLTLYRDVFGSEKGKRVLEDLTERFMYQHSGPHVQAGNVMGLAYIDGQRMLVRALQRWCTKPVEEHLDMFRVPLEMENDDPLAPLTGPGGQSGHYL